MKYLIIRKFHIEGSKMKPDYHVEQASDNLALANKKLVALNLLNEESFGILIELPLASENCTANPDGVASADAVVGLISIP